jgi:hypothetical protein
MPELPEAGGRFCFEDAALPILRHFASHGSPPVRPGQAKSREERPFFQNFPMPGQTTTSLTHPCKK